MLAPDATQIFTTAVVWLSGLLAVAMLAWELLPDTLRRSGERTAKRRLGKEIQSLRMSRMLELRGISLGDFVTALSPARLENAVVACRNCSNAARCEAVLQGYLPAKDYAFCPNREAFSNVLQLRAVTAL